MSAGRYIAESVDRGIAAVTCRFWWPVYAEFRDHGCRPEASLHLCQDVFAVDTHRITQRLRHPGFQGRLRFWVEQRIREVLLAPDSSQPSDSPIAVDPREAEARDPLRLRTRSSPMNQLPSLQQRWAIVVLETALEQLLTSAEDPVEGLELDELLDHLDQPQPSGPRDGFASWINAPQILSLKHRFWNGLRRVVNETITDPRFLETEILELFPPR